MNPVLKDFILDLERLSRVLALTEQIVSLPSSTILPGSITDNDLHGSVSNLHQAASDAHTDMPIFAGVLLLYLAGRFENFVKEIFEDLCDTLADDCAEFSQLPTQMQQNMVKYTAEVISNPRKYGHAENGVIAFVSSLADNLNGRPLCGVNSKCLSITSENMWPDTLSDIFSRIGANKIWERLGQQAPLQIFFQSADAAKVTKEARKFLTEFMELRNKIAHPSGALEWPSIEHVGNCISFCETLSRATSDLCAVWASTLPTKVAEEGSAVP